jgi:uncharacterized protein (DUF433 family)
VYTIARVRDDNLGRDARIDSIRVEVCHIMQYCDAGYSIPDIADEFSLAIDEVKEAIEYTQKHDIHRD